MSFVRLLGGLIKNEIDDGYMDEWVSATGVVCIV